MIIEMSLMKIRNNIGTMIEPEGIPHECEII